MEENKDYNISLKAKLIERIKELECLYEIAQLTLEKSNSPIQDIFIEVLPIAIKAWQYPEITEVSITFDEKKYASTNFDKGLYFQRSEIVINNQKRGCLEVCYTQDKSNAVEGPFLAEERALINIIAKELSDSVERYESKEEKKILEQKLRHSDRLATVGELTAGIAHELNEPLGSILGFAQLIEEENINNQYLQKDIKKIINAAVHAREVIRKLMLYSRNNEKDTTFVNLNTIISDGFYLLENRCKKENITILKVLDDNLPELKANAVQINQVIVNLMVNAIQAMPNGGNLLLQTNFDKKNIYLVVQDNGGGIPENYMKKIFDPFFTTKEIGSSTGLGLSVVHGIVNSLKGKISVESNLGIGSRFELIFPIKKDDDGDNKK